MQRYMIHLKNPSFTPRDATALLYRAREELAGDPEVVVRDARVSKKYIELDTSIPDEVGIKAVLERLERAISPLASYEHIVEHRMEKGQAIRRAIELFNDEKYWGAHEALEQVWKEAAGPEKDLLNGIILVAAAFVHDEKDEKDICFSILERAKGKLDAAGGYHDDSDSSGRYFGIDVGRLRSLVSEALLTRRIERFSV